MTGLEAIALCVGLPVVCGLLIFFAPKIWWWSLRRSTCRSVNEDRYSRERCQGEPSAHCLDRLCPLHCADLHKGACMVQVLRAARGDP